jgi:hypothetical protein
MKEFECMGCNVNTDDIGEYYMVQDALWAQAASDFSLDGRGMLCIGCVENAIGRTLVPADFKRVPLNYMWPGQSARLRNRLGYDGKLEQLLVF